MKRKGYIIIFVLCLIAAAITAAAVWYFSSQKEEEPEEGVFINEQTTNGPGYYEDDIPHADPKIVGKWRSTDKKGWYKVYYDDYDEETKLFWGKEWDEGEDVQEEDLNYHGNGWFRWEKKHKVLREYATMDTRDMPIHRKYDIQSIAADTIVYCEPDYKITYRFARVE